LGNLGALSGPGLPNDNGDGAGFDHVQQGIAVFGDGQERGWLVERRDKCGVKAGICHFMLGFRFRVCIEPGSSVFKISPRSVFDITDS